MGEPWEPWMDEIDDDDGDGEFEEDMMNCQLGADGLCGAAGSEYCDFECPFRND